MTGAIYGQHFQNVLTNFFLDQTYYSKFSFKTVNKVRKIIQRISKDHIGYQWIFHPDFLFQNSSSNCAKKHKLFNKQAGVLLLSKKLSLSKVTSVALFASCFKIYMYQNIQHMGFGSASR
jgi:hypothetical protein